MIETNDKTNEIEDELAEKLQMCISIRDETQRDSRDTFMIYQDALIKILRRKECDSFDKMHEMYEVEY